MAGGAVLPNRQGGVRSIALLDEDLTLVPVAVIPPGLNAALDDEDSHPGIRQAQRCGSATETGADNEGVVHSADCWRHSCRFDHRHHAQRPVLNDVDDDDSSDDGEGQIVKRLPAVDEILPTLDVRSELA